MVNFSTTGTPTSRSYAMLPLGAWFHQTHTGWGGNTQECTAGSPSSPECTAGYLSSQGCTAGSPSSQGCTAGSLLSKDAAGVNYIPAPYKLLNFVEFLLKCNCFIERS